MIPDLYKYMIATAVIVAGLFFFALAGVAECGCTAPERREAATVAVEVNKLGCAVAHAISGKTAQLVAEICDIELAVAEAVVAGVADGGMP